MAWNPTHVQVAVQRAKDLLSKGKSGTNDVFVTIALNKEKYQTSLKVKATDPEWYEECDLLLPADYKETTVEITVLHRNGLGIDEFLGRLDLPLSKFSIHEPPRAQWYKLLPKAGHTKHMDRGEIEVRLSFIVSKVRDPDSLSTASSASKRLKSGKKMIKHAADVIGEKLGVKKKDRTTDHIPDIAGVDEGVLNTGDIAENYSLSGYGKKKPDTLSLPPTSPTFKRSPEATKKFQLLAPGKESKKDMITSSSHGSCEDLLHKAIDSLSDGGFKPGHRRAASNVGPDASSAAVDAGKPPKHPLGKRELLSKEKSQSAWEVSKAKDDFCATSSTHSDRQLPPEDNSSLVANKSSKEKKPGPELVVDDYNDDITAYIGVTKYGTPAAKADNTKQSSDKGAHSRQASVGSAGQSSVKSEDSNAPGGKQHGASHGFFASLGLSKEKPKDGALHEQHESKDRKEHHRPQASTQTAADGGSEGTPAEFRNLPKEVLVDMVVKMRTQLKKKEDHVRDLEEYIDHLLVRVMTGNPNLLQVALENTSGATKAGRL